MAPDTDGDPYCGFESHSLRQLHLTRYSLPARPGEKTSINTGISQQTSGL
jgi:hypothetical protein